jgi:zinc D-Ala-D-Ala dipeptidase
MNYIKICCFLLLTNFSQVFSQDIPLNKYGLAVIRNLNQYKKTIAPAEGKKMIELQSGTSGLVVDLRYATQNNFARQPLYPAGNRAYMRKIAVDKLRVVINELKQSGLGIKIWDAYRPYSVTEKIWDAVRNEDYAADPAKGSGHNRGIAVDLTLINLKTNDEIDMGTGFDNFSDTAHHAFINLNDNILVHRKILKNVMEKNGFKSLNTEWWHYSLPSPSDYELLDLSFKDLKKINRIQKRQR